MSSHRRRPESRLDRGFFSLIQIPPAWVLALPMACAHSGVCRRLFVAETAVGPFTRGLFSRGGWKTPRCGPRCAPDWRQTRGMNVHPLRARRLLPLVLAALLHGSALLAQPASLPSFAQLQAAGATIGRISVVTENIFDTTDPAEDKLLFRWANTLHVRTRPSVIERALLFKTGDPVSVRVLDETERLLRANRYLYDVRFRVVAVNQGVVDIEVLTRDTWTLDPGISISRSGGANNTAIQLREYNLLGTGIALGVGRSRTVDRSSDEFQASGDRVFGSRMSVAYSHASNSDGRFDALSVVRPFHGLDARRAGGFSVSSDDRIDARYNSGDIVGRYRHRQQRAETFGGWSAGLVGGWVQRYALGLALRDDSFALEPGLAGPSRLPEDEKLRMPFVRYELIEDRFEREVNRNLVGRPEFFALGLNSTVQLGWSTTALGSTRDALVYAASISRGFEPRAGLTLVAAGQLSGQLADGQVRRQRLGMQAQAYLPQSPRWLFYAALSADTLTRPQPHDYLLLGGDNGLRGYPLRYQSGTRRMLLTLEERTYTDLYLWQLFRIGGAAFLDVGRAWGGDNVNTGNPGWLANAGIGLRIVSTRAAFNHVLHVDLAFPLNTTPGIEKVQFLVRTRSSF